MFRVQNDVLQILFIPVDGRVSNLSAAAEQAKSVRFDLKTRYHFEELEGDEFEERFGELNHARKEYGKPSLTQETAKAWLNRVSRRLPLKAIEVAVIAVFVILVILDSPINDLLVDSEVGLGLASAGAVFWIWTYVKKLFRRERPD